MTAEDLIAACKALKGEIYAECFRHCLATCSEVSPLFAIRALFTLSMTSDSHFVRSHRIPPEGLVIAGARAVQPGDNGRAIQSSLLQPSNSSTARRHRVRLMHASIVCIPAWVQPLWRGACRFTQNRRRVPRTVWYPCCGPVC